MREDGVKNLFFVKSIDSFQCKDWLLHKHYAKRIPAIEYSFGLFDHENLLIGICTLGPPPRVMNNAESIFREYRCKTLELNRLCVNQDQHKNTLSFFVSSVLKLISKNTCIVSYADYTFGHQGYIYQATNWLYTGLNQIHERQVFLNGKEVHPRTACSMGFTNITEWAKNNKDVTLGDYTKKHRYFYFVGSKTQRQKMIKDLIYKAEPYPKGDNQRYDAGYMPQVQIQLF